MEQVTFVCTPEEAKDWGALKRIIEKQTGKTYEYIRWKKRSIDARARQIKINATFECSNTPLPDRIRTFAFHRVHHSPEVHIVGAGPAGLFAALKALLRGLKPVVFER
jgi:NADPH-dependent 2,4-dienoyl-CoA reductase/sulfur reductase-like enzyme